MNRIIQISGSYILVLIVCILSYTRSAEITDKHQQQADRYWSQAEKLREQGQYLEAAQFYAKSAEAEQTSSDPRLADLAVELSRAGYSYQQIGQYEKALDYYQQALAIDEQVSGSEHPDTASSLNNLAGLYNDMGDYQQAEPLYQRALAIREYVLGPEHPSTATSLNSLAGLYNDMGDYQQAEPLYQRALAIRERVLGSEHSATATSLNNLALLYKTMGDYQRAEPLYQRALAIGEQVLGPEHPSTAISLNNLAVLYYTMGDYQQAEPLDQRALAIDEQTLGPEHPSTAISLSNLAVLYSEMGDYQQAEPLYQRALAIQEQVLGPEHPDTAIGLNNLATLYYDMGTYEQVEPLYQRALAIQEQVLGPEHPDTEISLSNLALLSAAESRYEQAWGLSKRAQRINETLIDQIMGFSSERQKLAFLATKQGQLESDLSLVVRHLSDQADVRQDGLDLWLRRKGVILESQKRFQEALFQSGDPHALKTFQKLSQVRVQLMQLTFAGPGKAEPETYKQRLETLKAQKEQLEAELSRLSQAFAAQRQRTKADTVQVAAALPEQTALLEFAKIDMFNFKATGTEKEWQPAHYIAFVLHAGQPEQVGLIDLGETAPIETAIEELRAGIKEHQAGESAKALYDLVFAPLLPELGEVKDIFISPDGSLNLIPFEVLIGPDDRFLIEEHSFTYLATGRDLIGNDERVASKQAPLIIGDPDFDFSGINAGAKDSNGSKPASESTSTSFIAEISAASAERGSHALSDLYFKRLPGTREEAEAIHALMGKVEYGAEPTPNPSQEGGSGSIRLLYTDKDALEEVLMNAEAPRILHLATHGFFLEDQEFALEET